MRDRLIELITKSGILCDTCGEDSSSYCAEAIAEYLIENGVIVPPINIGQEFYHIEEYEHYLIPESYPKVKVVCTSEVEDIEIGYRENRFRDKRNSFSFKDIGKTVFLTKEEAEQTLIGGVQE